MYREFTRENINLILETYMVCNDNTVGFISSKLQQNLVQLLFFGFSLSPDLSHEIVKHNLLS